MRRRDFSIGLCASAAVCVISAANAAEEGASSAPYPQTSQEKAARVTPVNTGYPPGNVCRYGADPTGRRDSTDAFNAATFHDLDYSLDALLKEIVVPAGRFTISGTVYVRKGQRLRGEMGSTYVVCNNAGKGPTFKLGWGLIDRQPKSDPGGQPLSVEALFLLGGPLAGCIDCTVVAGAFLQDLFISAAALGLNIRDSGDLNVRNVIFDQGQTGISIVGSQNCQFSTLKFYLINYDVSVGAGTCDCQWNNCHSEYNRYSSILFTEGAAGIRNLKFTDWQYVYNPTDRTHYETYAGAIHNRAPGVIARFDACTFTNMPGYAYVHGTQTGSRLDFANCVFDGEKTIAVYTRSTAAAAIRTMNESVVLTGCSFRNLTATPIVVDGSLPSELDVSGGDYSGNSGTTFIQTLNRSPESRVRIVNLRGDARQSLINDQSAVPVTVRGCEDWFGAVRTEHSRHYVLVPYQLSNVYEIMLRANVSSDGKPDYLKSVILLAEKDNDRRNGNRSFITTKVSIQGAAHLNGPVALAVEFGKVGGGTEISQSDFGSLAVSWPDGYTHESIDIQMS
jgi:hypothetical protein